MTIQVFIKKPGEKLPPLGEGEMRYVVADNGFFLERRTAMFETSCRVEHCPLGLEPHAEAVKLHCGHIPEVLARSMLGFFRYAYDLHGGEAALLLLHDPLRRCFRWLCPRQTVKVFETWKGTWWSPAEIEYEEPLHLPPGFVILGDAHSHADMHAYASGTDKDEERYKDGLHIVVGRVHKPQVDLHIDFVMDGKRFPIRPRDVFAETNITPFRQVPKAWTEQILLRKIRYEDKEERNWQQSKKGSSRER